MYKHLVKQIAQPVHKSIYLKLGFKVKVLIWFFMKEVILITNNIIKQN